MTAMNTTKDNATKQIIELHNGIMSAARRSVQDAIEIGGIIAEQRESLMMDGEYSSWLRALPFDERTGRNYVQLYDYRHKCENVSDLSTAYKKVSEIEYHKKQSEEERKRALIAQYRRTGVKPEGWDRSLDYAVKKDDENRKRYEEQREQVERERQERIDKRIQNDSATDMFSKALSDAADDIINKSKERSEWKEKIRLSDSGKDDQFVDALMDYLETMDDDNRRIEACTNIIKVCKNISQQLQRVSA